MQVEFGERERVELFRVALEKEGGADADADDDDAFWEDADDELSDERFDEYEDDDSKDDEYVEKDDDFEYDEYEDDEDEYEGDAPATRRLPRVDLRLPLAGCAPLARALVELLGRRRSSDGDGGGDGERDAASPPLRALVETLAGPDAPLYELAAMISEPGAQRQPIHPDTPFRPDADADADAGAGAGSAAPLLTCFVALQDVAVAMGPTLFLLGTHADGALHARVDDPDPAVRARALGALSAHDITRAALLRAGDAVVFDSRALHSGGANDARDGASRALLTLTFRDVRAGAVGNVGSLRAGYVGQVTLRDLAVEADRLAALREGDSAVGDDAEFDEAFGEFGSGLPLSPLEALEQEMREGTPPLLS